MDRMNRSELVANRALASNRDENRAEAAARQAAYEALARATLAKLQTREAPRPRASLIPRMLGVVLMVGVATYFVGFVGGVW
jgi:hypothetical protein